MKQTAEEQSIENRIADLIRRMTVAEKIGQMNQMCLGDGSLSDEISQQIRAGRVGAVLNAVDADTVNTLQRIAVEESRLGIPLLVGRDVIHGYRMILPIPLGQAASWNEGLVEAGARLAALEASTHGINWTFAPMIDIARDARWGRIAESFGEDPYLASQLGVAMIRGYQGDDLTAAGSIAACAKHFAGYGASEGGRDYSTTNIPENELRNVYFRPFKAAVDTGVCTIMASFSDLNGIPATANEFLMRQVLRDEWEFDGIVVSDYNSIPQLCDHGLTADDRQAACEAVTAGVSMDMASGSYEKHLEGLIGGGDIDIAIVDQLVADVLRVKARLGLFENPYTTVDSDNTVANTDAARLARDAALQSVVMLKNDDRLLPLSTEKLSSIAVIGPLADDSYEQLGTWIFDADINAGVSCLQGIRNLAGDALDIHYVKALETSRSQSSDAFDEARDAARNADVVLLFLGEESILSGEAHCRADISLPGAQAELVRRVREAGTPVVGVILAGRPLVLTDVIDDLDAVLYAWHPGAMGGPAIAELLFGLESPSGKLPATFPRAVGQIPIYYNQKNSGRPAIGNEVVLIDDIPVRAAQTSFGMTAYHLDAGFKPLFAFGFGLSFAEFSYSNITTSSDELAIGESLIVSADLSNTGFVAATEVVQLYIRDVAASVTRPVRELKGFRRIHVEPGQTVKVSFELSIADLAFYGRDNRLRTEPGEFQIWIGGDSTADLGTAFQVTGGE